MAFLGNIGTPGKLYSVGGIQSFPAMNKIRVEGTDLTCGITKEIVDGDPSAPSMRVDGPFRHKFLWGVDSGTRTIKIRVKYSADSGAGFRPKLIINANSDINVAATSSEAPAGAGSWQVIGPITVTPSAAGALEVVLAWDHVFNIQQVSYWDTIEVS